MSAASFWKFVLSKSKQKVCHLKEEGGGRKRNGGRDKHVDGWGMVRGRRVVAQYVFCLAKPRDVGHDWGCDPSVMVAVAVVSSKIEPAAFRV